MDINEIIDKIIEEIVYAIFNAEIELGNPTETIEQIKEFCIEDLDTWIAFLEREVDYDWNLK